MTDKRTTELTEATTATTDDLLPLLDDPGGTPTLKKITLTNFLSSISSLLTAFTGDSGSGGTKGAVPAPSAGDAAALKFLKSDGTWAAATWGGITGTLSSQTDLLYAIQPQQGAIRNGKISVTVASNNLTLAIKTLAGNNPSASEPVYVYIGGAWRTITSSLSVTANAGTNWCNAGSAELATKEIDYFCYLGYNATDGVVVGFSRLPWVTKYDGFSTTSTSENFCKISTITTASANDEYCVMGRFAATLSAGAGYTWSVPTYTANNLIQRPIYETRVLSWAPQYSGTGSMTYTSVTTNKAAYKLFGHNMLISLDADGTTGGTASYGLVATLPFTLPYQQQGSCAGANGGSSMVFFYSKASNAGTYIRYDGANFGLGTLRKIFDTSMVFLL